MEVANFLKVALSAEASEFSRWFQFPEIKYYEWHMVERDEMK